MDPISGTSSSTNDTFTTAYLTEHFADARTSLNTISLNSLDNKNKTISSNVSKSCSQFENSPLLEAHFYGINIANNATNLPVSKSLVSKTTRGQFSNPCNNDAPMGSERNYLEDDVQPSINK